MPNEEFIGRVHARRTRSNTPCDIIIAKQDGNVILKTIHEGETADTTTLSASIDNVEAGKLYRFIEIAMN
jgi:hypothetical protein